MVGTLDTAIGAVSNFLREQSDIAEAVSNMVGVVSDMVGVMSDTDQSNVEAAQVIVGIVY